MPQRKSRSSMSCMNSRAEENARNELHDRKWRMNELLGWKKAAKIISFISKQHSMFFNFFLSSIRIVDYEVKYLLCRHIQLKGHIIT
jgi:hypothetical protein